MHLHIQIEEKAIILQFLKDSSGIDLQFLSVFREDEDVVYVDNDPSFMGFHNEDFIHHVLEGGWRIAKAKEHDQWFK